MKNLKSEIMAVLTMLVMSVLTAGYLFAGEIDKNQTIEITDILDLSGEQIVSQMGYQWAYDEDGFDWYTETGDMLDPDLICVLPDKADEPGAFEIDCQTAQFSFMGIMIGDTPDEVTPILEGLKNGQCKYKNNFLNNVIQYESFENEDFYFYVGYDDGAVSYFYYTPRVFMPPYGSEQYVGA